MGVPAAELESLGSIAAPAEGRRIRKGDGVGAQRLRVGSGAGRAEGRGEEWREQLVCVIETADLSWNRGRGEEQPAESLALPTVAWRPGGDQRSLLVTGCRAAVSR
jgi:hypothetical protein